MAGLFVTALSAALLARIQSGVVLRRITTKDGNTTATVGAAGRPRLPLRESVNSDFLCGSRHAVALSCDLCGLRLHPTRTSIDFHQM